MLDDFGAVLCDEADLTHISRTDVALARRGEGIFDEIDGVIDREVDAEGRRLGGALLVLPLELVVEEGLDERLARAGHLKRSMARWRRVRRRGKRDVDSDRLGQTGKRHVTVSRDRRAGIQRGGVGNSR